MCYAGGWWAEKLDFQVCLSTSPPASETKPCYSNTKYSHQGILSTLLDLASILTKSEGSNILSWSIATRALDDEIHFCILRAGLTAGCIFSLLGLAGWLVLSSRHPTLSQCLENNEMNDKT